MFQKTSENTLFGRNQIKDEDTLFGINQAKGKSKQQKNNHKNKKPEKSK